MLVIIEDRNDNAPVFQNTGFSADISEVTFASVAWGDPKTLLRTDPAGGGGTKNQEHPVLWEGAAAGTKPRASGNPPATAASCGHVGSQHLQLQNRH